MNKERISFLIFALAVLINYAIAEEFKSRFGGLSPDDPAINTPPRHISDEELADPPPGEIRKMYLYEVNDVRAQYAAKIASAPDGAEGKDSPFMPKAQAIKADLDKIANDRLQSDVFALIPKIILFDTSNYDENGNSPRNYFADLEIALTDLSVGIVNAIAEHVIDQEGNVSAANLLVFTDTMIYASFLHENRWQDEERPIDPAGVMIMSPEAVVNHLKTKPWKYADRFLGIWTESETEPFKRYEVSGDGIPALKAKYAANKATIKAKWNELETWMKAQQAADPTFTAPSGE